MVEPTAAFLQGWRVRHPQEEEVTKALVDGLASAHADSAGAGFGIRPGDGQPRTYSTAYALLALGTDVVRPDEARWLLAQQDPQTGAWPYRPRMPPSRLGTALALQALALHGALPDAARIKGETWLLERLEAGDVQDEDSFYWRPAAKGCTT